MDPEETITIPLSEYEGLLEAAEFLSCLENAGVDNWEGYEEACIMFGEED